MATDDIRPTAEIDRLQAEYEEAIGAIEASGEPLNIICSQEVRERLETYLKQSAAVIEESGRGPLLTDMVVFTTADSLPHMTKGAVREALTHYIRKREEKREQEKSMEHIRGDHERFSD